MENSFPWSIKCQDSPFCEILVLSFLRSMSCDFLKGYYCLLILKNRVSSALLRLRAVVPQNSPINPTSLTPCQWEGIKYEQTINRCNRNSPSRWSPFRPAPIEYYRESHSTSGFSLWRNTLSGPIPFDTGLYIELVNINLEDNLFLGEIPNGLFKLNYFLRLNFAIKWFSE